MIAYPEAPAQHAVPGLTCAWRRDDHGVRITAVGEIDLCTAPALRDTLLWAIRRHASVSVDLTRVTFFNASGVNVILEARALAQRHDRELRLKVSPIVARVFDALDLTHELRIEN